jgi:hypothetical protein
MISEMEFLNSAGFAEIGADSEEFNGGNTNEDGMCEIGGFAGEEFYWPEMDIFFELIFISLLDRE